MAICLSLASKPPEGPVRPAYRLHHRLGPASTGLVTGICGGSRSIGRRRGSALATGCSTGKGRRRRSAPSGLMTGILRQGRWRTMPAFGLNSPESPRTGHARKPEGKPAAGYEGLPPTSPWAPRQAAAETSVARPGTSHASRALVLAQMGQGDGLTSGMTPVTVGNRASAR